MSDLPTRLRTTHSPRQIVGELLDEAADRIEALEKALTRQTENMAFLVNHASLYKWHDKFVSELSEDRKLL